MILDRHNEILDRYIGIVYRYNEILDRYIGIVDRYNDILDRYNVIVSKIVSKIFALLHFSASMAI